MSLVNNKFKTKYVLNIFEFDNKIIYYDIIKLIILI